MSQSSDIDSLPFFLPSAGPDYAIETKLTRTVGDPIAGVDEAGRGPLAGPVVAAAVILDPKQIPAGLNDSKQLSEMHREKLFTEILNSAIVAWASSPPEEIDAINIREATLLAMTRAVSALPTRPTAVLIDGRDVPPALIKTGQALVKGDARSVSVAAASIVAKVVRDRMMQRADRHYPEFGFASHKGYGTVAHRNAIRRIGPCPLHRRSFAPMRHMSD